MATCQVVQRAQGLVAPAPPAPQRSAVSSRRTSVLVRADPAALQEVIVGGAVTAATAAAMMNGLSKGEPEICPTCSGTGAQAPCLVCNGEGSLKGSASADAKPGLSGRAARSSGGKECRVCAGVGIIYCKQCSGSGYTKRL